MLLRLHEIIPEFDHFVRVISLEAFLGGDETIFRGHFLLIRNLQLIRRLALQEGRRKEERGREEGREEGRREGM